MSGICESMDIQYKKTHVHVLRSHLVTEIF